MVEPVFIPPPGWVPVDFPRTLGEGRSFVSGETTGDRLIVHYYASADPSILNALAWWGPGAEGPPGHAHGGSMAAVLDEGMGFAAWHGGHPVVAATITVNFRQRLPLGRVHGVTCGITRVERAKVYTEGRIYDLESGEEYANAEGLFIVQPLDSFGSAGEQPPFRRASSAGGNHGFPSG